MNTCKEHRTLEKISAAGSTAFLLRLARRPPLCTAVVHRFRLVRLHDIKIFLDCQHKIMIFLDFVKFNKISGAALCTIHRKSLCALSSARSK